MPLDPSSRYVRPYAGRSDAFADAMARAEQKAQPKVEEPMWIGRTRSGMLRHRDGHFVQPGLAFPADDFAALPLVD